MALSDLVVRQAKATGKAYTLPDIDGLSLAVTATGSKSWHFRYYWMKEPKRMSLGTYPEVSLREARALRDEARALRPRTSTRAFTASKSAPQSNSPVKTPSRRSTRSGLHTANSASRRAGRPRSRSSLASSPRMCCPCWASARSTTSNALTCWK